MSINKLKIFYLASAEIAVPVLHALHNDERLTVVGCGTQPDRRQGRKRQKHATPIGAACEAAGIDCEKPESVNDPSFLEILRRLMPDIILVFAFGQILKRQILELPEFGCINIHASLLPKYRGASPVNAAILAGDKESGISIMKMTRGLDAGPVYKRFKCPINSDDTAQDLSDRLAELAATHTAEVLIDIAGNELTPIEQDESCKSIVKKLHKADGQIDWTSPAAFIERQVRAYAPWPGAWFKLQAGKRLRTIRLTKAAVIHEDTSGYQPGMVVRADKQAWQIACGDNKQLEIIKCIPDGKQEMSGCDFLRGSAIETGNFLYETNHCELRESSNEDCSVH